MYTPPPGTSTCPPPAAVQASIAFWIAAVLSVTPSAFAPYAVTSNVRAPAPAASRAAASRMHLPVPLETARTFFTIIAPCSFLVLSFGE